jgi:drug/metabolite transporter (DMT)-like permease
MTSTILGAASAALASSLYNLGVALQAMEARATPHDEALRASLMVRLLRRPRWLIGTALGVLGWPLQAAALLLAPLAVVQPALAFGLILLLVLGARTLGEHVGGREIAAVTGIIGGVAALAVLAPEHSDQTASNASVAAVLAVVGAVALAPYVLRRWLTGGRIAALSAGVAFAWSGISTKLAADALHANHWVAVAAWTAATGLGSGLALVGEMTALQREPATHVAPLVFVVQVVVPVAVSPLLTHEHWAQTPLGVPGVLLALTVVVGSAVLLLRSPVLRSLVDPDSSVESGTGESPRAVSAVRTPRSDDADIAPT